MEYNKRAYSFIMMAEEETLYERMRADPNRSIPLRDASQKLSRELSLMPGLISRLTAKTPDDLWAAYHEHPTHGREHVIILRIHSNAMNT